MPIVGDIGAGAVVGRQHDPRRGRVLELDEVRLVLDVERRAEPAGDRRVCRPHVDADLADGRMRQEVAAEQRVMLGLHGAALPHALDPLGAAAAGAVQAEPAAARLQPALQSPGTAAASGYGPATYVMSSRLDGQPLLDVGEVVGDRGRHALLGQEPEQSQAGVVVVVPGDCEPGGKPPATRWARCWTMLAM